MIKKITKTVHNRSGYEQCSGDKICCSFVPITVLGKICLEYCCFNFINFAVQKVFISVP